MFFKGFALPLVWRLTQFIINFFLRQPIVFSVPTHVHAAYQLKALPHNIKKYIFRMNVPDLPPLYAHEMESKKDRYAPGEKGLE